MLATPDQQISPGGRFRTRRRGPYRRNGAISLHFERDPIPYALDSDWPVGAEGF